MNYVNMFQRIIAVVNSCVLESQLIVARVYAFRLLDNYLNYYHISIDNEFNNEYYKLWVEYIDTLIKERLMCIPLKKLTMES